MEAGSKLYVIERIMTDGKQHAESNMEVCMNGSRFLRADRIRSVGKGESSQVFHPKAVGTPNAMRISSAIPLSWTTRE